MPCKNIFIITNSYPSVLSREKGFVLPELRAHVEAGHQITLLPLRLTKPLDSDLPVDVIVSSVLAGQFAGSRFPFLFVSLLFRLYFWRECGRNWRKIFSSKARILNFFRFTIKAESVYRALAQLSPKGVVYTYWCTGETVGVIAYKDDRNNRLFSLSRFHGYDLYEERECNDGYMPFRELVMDKLNMSIIGCESGKRYLQSKYPGLKGKLLISPLGVRTVDIERNSQYVKNVITFFSCSYPHRVKRLQHVYDVVKETSLLLPDYKISWRHYGCNETQIEFAISDSPSNLSMIFKGSVEPSVFMDDYRSSPTPVFVNMSSFEGQPVSIMEAMSCGLPVLATDVGGVAELVGESAALLVPVEHSAQQIAKAFIASVPDSKTYQKMSRAALARQRNLFDLETNHRRLADLLKGIG